MYVSKALDLKWTIHNKVHGILEWSLSNFFFRQEDIDEYRKKLATILYNSPSNSIQDHTEAVFEEIYDVQLLITIGICLLSALRGYVFKKFRDVHLSLRCHNFKILS